MKNKKELQQVALKKIKTLFQEARVQFDENPSLSDRYIKLARKIAMKVNLSIPKEYKRRFCRHCYSYLVPSKNCRVRINKSRVIYYCLKCKKFMRFVIKKK